MSDSLSDADKIRNKRLAKLGSQAQSQSETERAPDGNASAALATDSGITSGVEVSPDDAQQSKAKINVSKSDPSSSSNTDPVSPSRIKPAGGGHPSINISQARPTPAASRKREELSAVGNPRTKSPRPSRESIEDWESRLLGNIFRLTLDPNALQDSFGHDLHYVPDVKNDLEEQGGSIKLNTSILDQALLEAASNLKGTSPLDYLLGCWKRVSRQFRGMKNEGGNDPKYNIVKEARRLCMSYCIFAITMPDMFGQLATTSSPLLKHFLVDPEDDRGVCHDFLAEAVARFDEDESIKDALVGAVEELSRQLSRMNMNDDYKPYVLALRNVVRYGPIVNALTQSAFFLPPDIPAQEIERRTLLGPFFQISPLQGEVTTSYFSSPETRDKGYIVNSQRALRMSLQTHQNDLLDIVNHVIRASKESRERVLDWFALTVNENHKRTATQVDQNVVSSDGFMINVTVCLDQLCEPFMDATFSKIDRIDVDYLRRRPRVNIRDETKLNADQNTSDEFYDQPAEGTSNFISEVFFLTLAAHHYGVEATNTKLGQMEKDLKYMAKQIEKLELDRHQFVSNPAQLRMFENALKKYKDQVSKGMSYKLAAQGVLLDDLSQARVMQFMRYAIVWLLRLVSPSHSYPKEPLKLPLPEEQPEVFKCLPEYFLEVVVGAFKFIMRNMPQVLTSTQSDELVVLCITFLRSSEYIKNPYLKSGLVTIMFNGIWPTWNRTKGVLGDLLNSLPFATEHLLHALMKFHIEAERTQFYQKFNIRYEIFQIIKCIWSNPIYREHLSQEAEVNLDFFVHFVNLLLNDVTFVLDESLNGFAKIHTLQKELENPASDLDATARTEKEEALTQAQGQAKSYMQLTNETVAMLKLFTEALADSFTMPEIVQRLADMLDYNLDALVGPKSGNLKVQNPEQYSFNPKVLLSEIVDVYLNLGHKEDFQLAVARDGRSYKPANFEKATVILRKWGLKSAEELASWAALGEKFKEKKELDDQAEEDLGEVPDEFLDPLMFTLMEDPVILPTSKISIDRSTIRSHLLSDPNDPFNRAPLTIGDVVPDTDLKAKIQAFKAEKKGKKPAVGVATDQMDTTAG
ncbi:MAG: hypothetical protein M1819_006546 [Sarea resinae]|nr:MAG: hypothetical protein M1819_006546 [Sarea resinae]